MDEWCKNYFDTTFANLPSVVGCKKTVYCYDTFSSLFEVETVEKFTEAQKGKLYPDHYQRGQAGRALYPYQV